MRLLICLILFCATQAHADCPKDSNNDPLTFDQVMINFSNYLNAPDLAADDGVNDPTSVSDQALQKAVTNIGIAIDCANAVLNDTTGQLYPPEYYSQKTDAEKTAYLNLLDGYMSDFAGALTTYQTDFQQLQGLAVGSRDFSAVEKQSNAVEDIATSAHQDLQ
jgi:hypothetical protein